MNGHWTQTDPANNPFQTHGWNGYNYAGGDTTNLSDPNGMLFGWSCDLCGRAASTVRNTVTQVVTHPIQSLAGCWGAVRLNLIAVGQLGPGLLAAESTIPGGILTVSAGACLVGAVAGGYGAAIISSGISTRPPAVP